MSARYAFVVPRYGADIAGGAETLARELALKLAARGDKIEILTTTARDNRSWKGELESGTSMDGTITVHRFNVDPRNLEAWIPRQIDISKGIRLSIEDQLEWMAHSVNASAMYRFIEEEGDRFDALFFAPYLFGTTFWGSLIHPERSILIPCLHDESYAYLEILTSMFRQVRGCLFNAVPEMRLARRLYGEIGGDEVGMGFVPPSREQVESLTPLLSADPYLLYLGRKETAKGVSALIDDFIKAKQIYPGLSPLRLVIAGGGSFSDLYRDEVLSRGDILDLAQLSELDKQRLLRHAVALAQPSTNESFSIVLMESWMVGTPVLVSSDCAVTRHHVEQSGGGLHYRGAEELGAVLLSIHEDKVLRQALAAAGDRYLRERYSWDAVLRRFDRVMEILSVGTDAHQDQPSTF